MQTWIAPSRALALAAALLSSIAGTCTIAQEVVMQAPGGRGRPGGPPPGVVVQPMPGQPGQPAPGTPADGEKKEGDAKPDEAKPDEAKNVVNRPEKPPTVPDPKELEAKPDDKGRIQFSFNGQTWPDVMQWLANVSGQSLDWQELPSDYLNLTTQHSYTLPEARDLINRHLQARGYTSLLTGEVLSVFKIEKLDPSLVPRVPEEELYDRLPHDWVKVSFQVPEGMEVAKAAEDVKQVLSSHAKVMPLASTKRLLLIDAVANLRDVSALMNEERLAAGDTNVPKEFVLKHRRAEKVIDILYVILGLDPASRPTQMDLQLQQQKLQILAQMQQSGKDVTPMLQKDGPPVYLAFNRQNNSILANAPKEQLEIIERSIKMLDVPTEGEEVAADTTSPSNTFAARTSESYKLKTMNPNALVSTLEEIGDLDPLTELRADDGAKILFVRASASDHSRIEELIQQLDDTNVVIEIFRLRRHAADAVAGTITAIMGKPEKKEENNRRSYYYYDPWNRNNEQEKAEEIVLKVDADVENNRLIVRGTAEQVAEVRSFLAKMGELGHEQPNQHAVRVLDGFSPEDAKLTLERLRAAWPGELKVNTEEPKQEAPAPAAESTETKDSTTHNARDTRFQFAVDARPSETDTTANDAAVEAPAAIADDSATAAEPPAAKAPPVTITVTNDGRLVVSSDDARAVEQIQDLMETLAPPPIPFKEYPLKHIPVLTAWANLTYILKEELEDKEDSEFSRDWWSGDWIRKDKGGGPAMLSKRRKLVIDYDEWTNSILVRHGTPAQLAEIERLLKVYDQPRRANTISARRTEVIKLQYSKASVIAAALKEVYRDLLSSRDKEFDTGEEGEKRSGYRQQATTIIHYSLNGSGQTKETEPLKASFEGALAVGVDDSSNTLVISAETALFDSIVEMVHILDEQGKTRTQTRVVHLDGNVNLNTIRQALGRALPSATTTTTQAQPQVQVQQVQADDGRDRRDRRRRNRDNDNDNDGDNDSGRNRRNND